MYRDLGVFGDAWLSVVVCVDVLYKGGRCGFKCLARLGVVELNVVCSCWCVKVCCIDIYYSLGVWFVLVIGSVVCACEWN